MAEPLGNRSQVDRLLASPEPSLRWRALTEISGAAPDSPEACAAQAAVPGSERVRRLLSERATDGTLPFPPYLAKWYGAHWVLVALAELGYPPGDDSLAPLREQALGWVLSEEYVARYVRRRHGRVLLHASIDGNVVWSLLRLGLADVRVEVLLDRIRAAQWPDGGWNCDRRSSGRSSSFTESLVPLRALALHAGLTGDEQSREAAGRAAEFFLQRRLFRRRRDGQVIRPSFTQLHFPCYWHYDVLFALTVLAEAGFLTDPRCGESLDLVAAKRLADGGFPAEARFYRVTATHVSGRSLVDWGPTSARRANDWVTVAALAVLAKSGRRPPEPDASPVGRPATVADVHAVARGMPGATVARGSSGNPVYQVGGKSFVFFRNPRPDAVDPHTGERYDDAIVLWVGSEADKQALVQDPGSPFFTTPHFDGHPSVLVRACRLGEISRDELAEIVEEAWLARASAARARTWLGEHGLGPDRA